MQEQEQEQEDEEEEEEEQEEEGHLAQVEPGGLEAAESQQEEHLVQHRQVIWGTTGFMLVGGKKMPHVTHARFGVGFHVW